METKKEQQGVSLMIYVFAIMLALLAPSALLLIVFLLLIDRGDDGNKKKV